MSDRAEFIAMVWNWDRVAVERNMPASTRRGIWRVLDALYDDSPWYRTPGTRGERGGTGMTKHTWPVSCMAECNDCEWKYENHRNAAALGAKHAMKHNHFVRIETVLVSYYNKDHGPVVPEVEGGGK